MSHVSIFQVTTLFLYVASVGWVGWRGVGWDGKKIVNCVQQKLGIFHFFCTLTYIYFNVIVMYSIMIEQILFINSICGVLDKLKNQIVLLCQPVQILGIKIDFRRETKHVPVLNYILDVSKQKIKLKVFSIMNLLHCISGCLNTFFLRNMVKTLIINYVVVNLS